MVEVSCIADVTFKLLNRVEPMRRAALSNEDASYFRKRAAEERKIAHAATDSRVHDVHLTFAEIYEARAEACVVRKIGLRADELSRDFSRVFCVDPKEK